MLKHGVLSLLVLINAVNCEYSLKGIKALVSSNYSPTARTIIIDGPEDIADAYAILINDPKLKKLGKGSFPDIPRLDSLVITNGQLQDIDPEAFGDLPVLRNLILSGNQIEAIQDNIFNGLQVRNINLTDNKISKIYGNAFDNLPNLKVISLSHNKLSTYNNQWFKSCPKLYRLIMHHNSIEAIPANMLKNLKDNEDLELWFMNNKIKTIKPKAFADVKKIRDLWLGHNDISDVNEDTFKGVEVENLQMDNNDIKCISEEVLRGMSVTNLDIDWNPMDCKCLEKIRKFSKSKDDYIKTMGRALECMQKRIAGLLANQDNLSKYKEVS